MDREGSDEKVRAYWDAQALTYGADNKATLPDSYYREVEIRETIKRLVDGWNILDVGCGNGWSTNRIKCALPHSDLIVGMDYSEAMLTQARKSYPDITFFHGNILTLPLARSDYDAIVSIRCLINLQTWGEQQAALWRMRTAQHIILVEHFEDGLRNINKLRVEFRLPEIKRRWHNRYFEMDEFIPFAKDHFVIREITNLATPYYLVSRLIHAALAQREGKEPAYDHPLNELAAKLPIMGQYHYSPYYLVVLEVPR